MGTDYYGQVCNWFVEKLVDLNHACSCLSVLWTAILESMVRTVSCSSNKMNQPQSPKRNKKPQKNNFWCNALRKMGSAKKIAKIKYFLPILDGVANFLLIINSKNTQRKH